MTTHGAEDPRDVRRRQRAWALVVVSLFCCVFEGAVRKWGVGDATVLGRLAYLSKYIPMAMLLVAPGWGRNPFADRSKRFATLGLAMVALGAAISSFSGINLVGALLTILNCIVLPAAAWQAGRLIPGDALRRLAWWACCMALLMGPLAVVQFYSPAGSRINRYSTTGEGIATAAVSERVRATGTFSYITGLGEFAMFAVWAGIVTFSTARSDRERWIGYGGLLGGLCCAFASVSRSVTLIALAFLAAWALFGGQLNQKAKSAIAVAVVCFGVLMATGRMQFATEMGSTVYMRHQAAGSDSVAYRLWYSFVLPLNAVWMAPLGHGLGTEQAGRVLSATPVRGESTFESPWGRTIMELGVIGFLGVLVTWGIFIVPWREAFRRCTPGGAKSTLVVTGVALAARGALGYQFNHVAAYFFWVMAACVLALGNAPAFRGAVVRSPAPRVEPGLGTRAPQPAP